MTKQRLPPDDPREWLNRARSNLALAGHRVSGVYPKAPCFLAQQVVD
jgi:HEPN domain-containing protein